MKTKIAFLLAIIFSMTLAAQAQKVSVDSKTIRIPFRQMAEKPMPEDQRTFTIIPNFRVKSPNLKRVADLRVEGLTYVNTDEAGLIVNVNFSGIVDKGCDIEPQTSTITQKDGSKKTETLYRAIIRYSYDLSFTVTDVNGNKLSESVIQSSDPIRYAGKIEAHRSKDYKTDKEAVNYIKLNKASLFAGFENDAVKTLMRHLQHHMEHNYGYAADVYKASVQYLDNKKHELYAEHQKLLSDILNGLGSISANGGVEEAKISLAEPEQYLKTLPDKFADPKDKNHIKMRFIAFYNLALIYANTDRFGMAKDMIEKALANDYETRDCKKLKEWIENQETRMKSNNITSLHFIPQESEMIDEEHPAKWILAIRAEEAEEARLAAEAAAKAAQALLDADEYLGELKLEAVSPTKMKLTVTVVNEQVKERANTVGFIINNGTIGLNEEYMRKTILKGKGDAECTVSNVVISPDGSTITALVSNLKVDESYSFMAFTNWNGVMKYTSERYGATPGLTNDEWVDLGLPSGTKWAMCNMGAKKFSKLGNLYSWYSTTPFDEKAEVPHSIPFSDLPASIAGDPEHDAATALYGQGAQIPTLAQWEELFRCCEVYHIKVSRTNGYYFESPYNHNSIFIPYTDFISDIQLNGPNNYARYWTADKDTQLKKEDGKDADYIRYFRFGFGPDNHGSIRYYGKLHIRAVRK